MGYQKMLCLAAAMLLTAGCGFSRQETAVPEQLIREETARASLPEAVPTEPEAVRQTGAILTPREAEQIALARAGIRSDQASGLRTQLETDDGRWQYDVHFFLGSREYEVEIDAETGRTLSFDVDPLAG